MATADTIHTHGYQHFDSLQLSAMDFYKTLNDIIKEYQYPDVHCGLEELKEGGLLSAKRQYFSVTWKRHKFLVCASPFGRSFFISWYHQENANSGANFANRFGLLGRAVASNMDSKTLYQHDAELMFVNCMNAIIRAAIDKVKAEKGFTVEDKPSLN